MGVSPRHGLLAVCLLLSLSCAIAEVEDLNNAEPDDADRVKRQVSPYLYQQYQNQRTDDQFDRRAEESEFVYSIIVKDNRVEHFNSSPFGLRLPTRILRERIFVRNGLKGEELKSSTRLSLTLLTVSHC